MAGGGGPRESHGDIRRTLIPTQQRTLSTTEQNRLVKKNHQIMLYTLRVYGAVVMDKDILISSEL